MKKKVLDMHRRDVLLQMAQKESERTGESWATIFYRLRNEEESS